jgi:hypothetical protein
MECENLKTCPFFNDRMEDMPTLAGLMKKQYCLSDNYTNCARYMVFKKLGKERVPSDMFPNQLERAQKIIQDAR